MWMEGLLRSGPETQRFEILSETVVAVSVVGMLIQGIHGKISYRHFYQILPITADIKAGFVVFNFF